VKFFSGSPPQENKQMLDVIFLAVGLGFFALWRQLCRLIEARQ
jgi:hypothetical protein